ncbi:MAG: hypothetical protein WBX00_33965 [Isosphaeraceae bacterium]
MEPRLRRIAILDDRMAELLRSKTEAERFAMIDRSWRFARQMIQAMIVHEHPDWSEDQVRREVARRMSHGAV